MKKGSIWNVTVAVLLGCVMIFAACGEGEPTETTAPSNPCEAGHTYGDWSVTVAASCSQTGERQRACTVCRMTEREALPLLDHTYTSTVTPPTDTEDGYTTYRCSVCGQTEINDYIDVRGGTGLAYRVNGDGTTCTVIGRGISNAAALTVPSTIGGYSVTAIGERAFADQASLSAILLPDTVVTIGKVAFAGCTALTEMTVPSSVTSIGAEIFHGCIQLRTVYYNSSFAPKPEEVFLNEHVETVVFGGTEVPDGIADTCTNLTTVVILDGVTRIGAYAFYECENLTSLTVPASVTEIGADAFEGCSRVQNIYLSEIAAWCNVTFVTESSSPFWNCSANLYLNGELATELVFPDGLERIENWFWSCASIQRVVVPDGVTNLGEYAFAGCRNLESAELPDTLTRIGFGAFRVCENLKSITIPDGVTSIGNQAFFGCTSLTSLTLPDSVTQVGEAAFQNCEALTEIRLSANLTRLAGNLFENCRSLRSITLSAGVTQIGALVFSNCSSLEWIVVPAGVTSIGHNIFVGCTALSAIYYLGTADEWATITLAPINTVLKETAVYCYSETSPTDGNGWHYVDGVPTKW